jgi:response regulator RpfG family c-di-GMP phosphodiesterase
MCGMSESDQAIQVLVVDDEENILRALQRLLMDEEIEVHTATSGEAGLAVLKKLSNVGLIVSDQRMPGMNGAEFLGHSQEYVPHAQRILLTGYSDINSTIEAINKGGASRYISKPWDDDDLVKAVRDAVDIYKKGMEMRRLNEIINQQKQELEEWNEGLKKRLLQSTSTIREQSQTIRSLDKNTPAMLLSRVFDNFFEIMGDRNAVHARTVSILVTDVARKMNLDSDTVARFRQSELSEYRHHPLRGEEMFRQVENLADILPLIRGHHESFDGKGFPDGLSEDQIPLGARLIAIADLIEKSASSVERNRADYAMMNARYHGGILLDPQLVTKFQVITRIVYFEGKKAGIISEVEIGYMELLPGMIISKDVVSGAGVLLMQRGTIMDASGVALIRSHYRKDPTKQGIFVQITED